MDSYRRDDCGAREILHVKLEETEFMRCGTDICLCFRRQDADITIVGDVLDDLQVTASSQKLVEVFFDAMNCLSIKELGKVANFSGCALNLVT